MDNVPDRCLMNLKSSGDGRQGVSLRRHGSNLDNLGGCQFVMTGLFPTSDPFRVKTKTVLCTCRRLTFHSLTQFDAIHRATFSVPICGVINTSSEEQVIRIDTMANVAMVKNTEIPRDRATSFDPTESVRPHILRFLGMSVVDNEPAVAIPQQATSPYPARPEMRASLRNRTVYINEFPETGVFGILHDPRIVSHVPYADRTL